MNRTVLMLILLITFSNGIAAKNADGIKEREYWVQTMIRIVDPVLNNLSEQKLKLNMPYESKATDRKDYSYLEAFGRVMCGISPWLELGLDNTVEGKLREKYIKMSLKCIENATNPKSPDYMAFSKRGQTLVDAAFLSQGLLRAPKQLWGNLSDEAKQNLVEALKLTRITSIAKNNWSLFPAMIEAALLEFTGQCDMKRLLTGINYFKDKGYYKGDGNYGDGFYFHMDYYNSFVIHPMITDVLTVMKKYNISGYDFLDKQLKYHRRYAEIQERFISPEGTYPVVGRSIAYRFGVFHALAQASLMHNLPKTVVPGQVRSALTTVIKRQLKSNDNFDNNGWQVVGFTGKQMQISERYINTGSLYLCSTVFLPLGLPVEDEFWNSDYTRWTSLKAWNGESVNADHSINE